MMTDPISDMLNRVRNALARKYDQVDIPQSRVKKEIARLLKEEGFIKNVEAITNDSHPFLRLGLKYRKEESIITGLKRVSLPGRRVYVGWDRLPSVRGGLGMAVISTPQGIMTEKDSRKRGIGGEVICYVW